MRFFFKHPPEWLIYPLLLITLGIFEPITVLAQDNEPIVKELSLTQAIETALSHNPQLTVVRSLQTAAEERVTQARSGYLPQIGLSQQYQRTTNPMWAFGTRLNQERIAQPDFDPARLNDPDPIDDFITRLSFVWSLFDGGTTRYGVSQAKLGETAAGYALAREKERVTARTVIAYLDTLIAMERITVAEKTLKTARANQKMIEDRYAEGLVVRSDLLRDQVHVAELEQQHIQSQSEAAIARSVLNITMGVAEETVYRLTSSLADEQLSGAGKIDPSDAAAWIVTALDHRADYDQVKTAHQLAEVGLRKARAAHWPTVGLTGGYEWHSEDFSDMADSYMLGVSLNMNLFAGGRISAGVREAQAELAAAEARVESVKQQVALETRQAYLMAENAAQRITIAESALAQAEENIRIVRDRYQNGLMTVVELLDAETALHQAVIRRLRTIHAHRTALVNLKLATGVM